MFLYTALMKEWHCLKVDIQWGNNEDYYFFKNEVLRKIAKAYLIYSE